MCRPTRKTAPLRRDEVITACQQACPTKAIVFGDLKDEGSAVAKRRRSGRHYVAARGTRHAAAHDLSRALE